MAGPLAPGGGVVLQGVEGDDVVARLRRRLRLHAAGMLAQSVIRPDLTEATLIIPNRPWMIESILTRNAAVIAIGFVPRLFSSLTPYVIVGLFLASIILLSWLATVVALPAVVALDQASSSAWSPELERL